MDVMMRNKRLVILLLFVFGVGIVLSLLRYPDSDESFYLRETLLLSETLQNFQWFGNEPVGLHGFLFKLPAALLFLVTGPSVFIATLTNLIFGLLCVYLVYKFFLFILSSEKWAFWGAFLFSTSVYFLQVLPTFLREVPAILATLLVIHAVINKKNDWMIGLAFLLLLDAKEGIFFVIGAGFIIWLFYTQVFREKETRITPRLWRFVKRAIIIQIPVFLYLFLMLCTGLVPLNKKLIPYIGLNEGGFAVFAEYQADNVMSQYQKEIVNHAPEKDGPVEIREKSRERNIFQKTFDLFHLYARKILYFRTFSLTSTPRFLILIAVAVSFLIFKRWRERNENERLFLPIIFWCFLLCYILRTSHGRYLLPILPVIILFFLLFIRDVIKDKRFALVTIGAAAVFVTMGMLFETDYILFKTVINTVILAGLLVLYFHTRYESRFHDQLKTGLILLIGLMSFAINLSVSYLRPGQIGIFYEWGYCGEYNKIADTCKQDVPIWSNIEGELFQFFMNDLDIDFHPDREMFTLKPWVPKARLLKGRIENKVFSFGFKLHDQFHSRLKKEQIQTVALVVSTSDDSEFQFPYQQRLDEFNQMDFLSLKNRIEMKNKIVYIYTLVN